MQSMRGILGERGGFAKHQANSYLKLTRIGRFTNRPLAAGQFVNCPYKRRPSVPLGHPINYAANAISTRKSATHEVS